MARCHQAQAITWVNVDQDLCRHKASLDHTDLKNEYAVCLTVMSWVASYRVLFPFTNTILQMNPFVQQ